MTLRESDLNPADLGGIPNWKQFLQRDDAEGKGFSTPDGKFYHLAPDEELTFSDVRPGNVRDVLIKKNGASIPFEAWKADYKNPNEK